MDDSAALAKHPENTFTKREGLLAHYTTASAAFEHILPSGELRLSPYRMMRDPVENKDIVPSIAWSGAPPEVDRAIRDVYDLLKAARDRMRVLSLTHDAEERGEYSAFDCCWSRPRMWEQDGEVHRGVCLLFDRGDLERAISEERPRERMFMRNVDYTREGIAASAARTMIDERMFKGKERARAVADYIEARHDAFFFLKSDDFATEYEYRVVLEAGDDDYTYINHGDSLVGIVLGERFPKWERPAAIAACSELAVKLARIVQ
jgi:hypothetical protein